MVSDAQAGTLGEALFTAYCIWSTQGRLEAYRPLTDDDHRDFALHRRGSFATAYVQVKTAARTDAEGRIVARARYPADAVTEAPGFLYAVVHVAGDAAPAIAHAWLVPSADFNRRAFREPEGAGHVQLVMEASTRRADRWSPFAVDPAQLGATLLDRVTALPANPPPVPGALLLLAPR